MYSSFRNFGKKKLNLPADSELEAIDTKSLQIPSQNLLACSKSLALSFS